ncbi:MAG: siphovirus Gp157 family protein [Rhodothermales bacterium]|nr:siphovirus Gp157 family protein [Rhodothermales bacterium]
MQTPVLPLHTITAELAELEAAIIDAGGEITDEIDARYSDLLRMEAEKVTGYVAVYRRLSATADAYKAEADRLAAHAKAAQRSADALKERLLYAMLQRGETEHVTPLGKVAVRFASTRPVVLRVEPQDLPDAFRVERVDADKRALADALKAHDPAAEAVATFGDPAPFLSIR